MVFTIIVYIGKKISIYINIGKYPAYPCTSSKNGGFYVRKRNRKSFSKRG